MKLVLSITRGGGAGKISRSLSKVQDKTPEVTQQPRQPAQTSKTTSNGKVQLITLDDIPPSQWRDRFQEFKAFLFLQIQKPHAQTREISLIILDIVEKARSEYFKIQCCSMNKTDLEVHFQKMSRRFYLIGGINDSNLKQAFISSI
ncbi:hypothetical protein TIFTF001_043987 [Ficus carica]|uniref:Uncharacterized protein n=1 Tax=Ficus carica TaxID=3494 RepID=A0AA88D470_FICCA|nr:hypothetical protein TIFTF001_043987 [Ficus carica]